MSNYLILWFHNYFTHLGMWVSMMLAITIYKSGVPKLDELKVLSKSILILAPILSLFSSQSWTHYLSFLR